MEFIENKSFIVHDIYWKESYIKTVYNLPAASTILPAIY